MISQSWDGTRVYITSSLLANWDKGGADNEQFLRGFTWDGKELKPAFEVDFTKEKLGRAHHMKLGSKVAASRRDGDSPRERWRRRCSWALAGAAASRRSGPRRRRRRCPRSTSSRPRRAPTRCTASCAAPDGEVLGVDGRPQRLSRFTRERHHAARVHLHELHRSRGLSAGLPGLRRPEGNRSGERPSLRTKVRLVTLIVRSRARHAGGDAALRRQPRARTTAAACRWYFLTTRSARELLPLVEGFGQDVRCAVDRSSGRPRRELSHVLKVFLIDRAGFVREIYTSTFLHPRTVLNDIETLRLER